MKGGEKIGAQDDHISADRIHNRPAPDLGLEHKIGTLCRNNSAKYHVSVDLDLAAGEEKSNLKSPHVCKHERPIKKKII